MTETTSAAAAATALPGRDPATVEIASLTDADIEAAGTLELETLCARAMGWFPASIFKRYDVVEGYDGKRYRGWFEYLYWLSPEVAEEERAEGARVEVSSRPESCRSMIRCPLPRPIKNPADTLALLEWAGRRFGTRLRIDAEGGGGWVVNVADYDASPDHYSCGTGAYAVALARAVLKAAAREAGKAG